MFDVSASSAVAVEPTVSSTPVLCSAIGAEARAFLKNNRGGLLGRHLCQHFRVMDYDCYHNQNNGRMLMRFVALFATDLIDKRMNETVVPPKVVGYTTINDALREFYSMTTTLRVGQFLCNKFEIRDPDIFYLTDATKARAVFFKKYGGIPVA